MIEESDNTLARRHRRGQEPEEQDKYAMLRQLLNVIFMVGAIIGMFVYFKYSHSVGGGIIICSMLFKVIECVLRLMK
ncbi:MAG: hypothetical protein IJL29_08700 [Prevotella sp.]|nr:hypothetical protein [Prevotella sp.]MBQ6033074.1 hypothetical protein [Prevotella sp.]MBQ6309156.1 hypothetical protein [Prevotella sp.]MBQ6658343.1 hypothetical protein [Prevotella sp.]MBQ7441851.1 hypothetical protein [Prevotella sp.]